MAKRGKGKTAARAGIGGLVGAVELVGTPDRWPTGWARSWRRSAATASCITCPVMRLNRRYVAEITDGLVPALQRPA